MRNQQPYVAIGVAALVICVSDGASAQLGSRPAEAWIAMMERPERLAGLKVEEIVGRLELKPGQIVADIGAGPGVFSVALAGAVGTTGRVYAEEVAPEFIDRINQKIHEQRLTNVQPVLGTYDDPRLPSDVDLAFFHDVLHHIEDRAGFLKTLAAKIKRNGRIAIIEYDARNGPHRADPTLQITPEQLDGWMAAIGFTRIRRIDDLFTDPRWFVVYGRK